MSLNDFIEYIEGVRDLHIELKGNRVYISDFKLASGTWRRSRHLVPSTYCHLKETEQGRESGRRYAD